VETMGSWSVEEEFLFILIWKKELEKISVDDADKRISLAIQKKNNATCIMGIIPEKSKIKKKNSLIYQCNNYLYYSIHQHLNK